jgi:hypothetical protein
VQPEQSIQPLNVAAATLLVQLLLITLLAITASLYRGVKPNGAGTRFLGDSIHGQVQLRRSPTLFVALASFAALLISDELYSIWSPIFQGVGINTISASSAIATVFVMDLLLIAYLVATTGGSQSSPFLPALFTVPALGIFLRLPPSMFVSFAILAAIIYVVLLIQQPEHTQASQFPSAFMAIACLFLSMFTGYITRPVPINELQKPKATHSVRAPAPIPSQPGSSPQ